MNLFEYTEKSIVLVGEDTKLYKDQIKDLFGKFNNFLKPRPEHKFDGGAGWIFSKSRKLDVEKFLTEAKHSPSENHLRNLSSRFKRHKASKRVVQFVGAMLILLGFSLFGFMLNQVIHITAICEEKLGKKIWNAAKPRHVFKNGLFVPPNCHFEIERNENFIFY